MDNAMGDQDSSDEEQVRTGEAPCRIFFRIRKVPPLENFVPVSRFVKCNYKCRKAKSFG